MAVTYTNFIYIFQASRAFHTNAWKLAEKPVPGWCHCSASFAEEETEAQREEVEVRLEQGRAET